MSDDEDLRDMLDVEFPGGACSSDEDETNEEKNNEIQVTMVDIVADGWDDDAISNCFHQAVSHYRSAGTRAPAINMTCDKDVDMNMNMDEYRFKSNRRLDEHGNVVNIQAEDYPREGDCKDVGVDNPTTEERNMNDIEMNMNSADQSIVDIELRKKEPELQDINVNSIIMKDLPLPKWALGDAGT